MADDATATRDTLVPITGRRLALPPGQIHHLQRAGEADHEIGAFRQWAGYKDLGSDAATGGLALFQHVLSFGPSEQSGRTGIHCHLAQVHIVVPTSGVGVFSYDGVVTDAVPGGVIVQHGGTVHDQFSYSYAAASAAENRLTPASLAPDPPDTPPRSFGFLELFVPAVIANVEIVAPGEVTPADQATAWDHPYHAPNAHYALQPADDPSAAWRPLAGHPDLEARDADTWDATGALVATHILRPARSTPAGEPIRLRPSGETGGVEVFFVASGSVELLEADGAPVRLMAGDCLTCTSGLAGEPTQPSFDLSLLYLYISARAEQLRQRTPEEIERLESLGAEIVTRREVRTPGDARPVNVLRETREQG